MPVESHVCGVRSTHCLLVGTQVPVQAAPEQAKGQTIVSCQLPLTLQVCSVLPLPHCTSLGVHVPVQLPVAQRNMQAWSPPQFPVASQVCAVLLPGPLHCLVFGTHDPVQTPAPVQTYGQSVPLVQLPCELQICCWVPTHCMAPGVQVVQAFEMQAVVQVVVFCQLPFVSQV